MFPGLVLNWEVRTATILGDSGTLSVHQLVAGNILRTALNAMRLGKPKYLPNMLKRKTKRGRNKDYLITPACKLNISMESFQNQAIRLINKLPSCILDEESPKIRKRVIKAWVSSNISVHPQS